MSWHGNHIAGTHAVAVIWLIGVARSECARDGTTVLAATGESRVAERLVQRADRMSGIQQFFVHSNDNAAQTDDDTQDTNRENEDEFGGDDHTGVVIPKFLHMRGLFD